MARLDRLCSEGDGSDDDDDAPWDENENGRRAKLFGWVVGISSNPSSR